MTARSVCLKLIIIFLALFVDFQQATPTTSAGPKVPSNVLVVGGGLAGLLQILQLFEDSHGQSRNLCKVHLFELREDFTRPQVLRLSTGLYLKLPLSIRVTLWPLEASHPRVGDYVQIANLQQLLFNYINQKYGAEAQDLNSREFFSFEFGREFSFKGVELEGFIKNSHLSAIVMATGNTVYNQQLRQSLGLDPCKLVQTDEIDKLGMYAMFQNLRPHLLDREEKRKLSNQCFQFGIFYFPANDKDNNAQVYIFPGENYAFNKFFSKNGSEDFLANKTFNTNLVEPADQPKSLQKFEEKLKAHFLKIAADLKIPLKSQSDIKFYSAPRQGYYHQQAAGLIEGVPVFFIGDGLSSTDYRLGSNVKTAYYQGEFLVENGIVGNDNIVGKYNDQWMEIVKRDFDRAIPSGSGSPSHNDKDSKKGWNISNMLCCK